MNWHFHFLNFPTASSLLHIREILVHWPFLEIPGPQKWVVRTTFALKHNFLAGTLGTDKMTNALQMSWGLAYLELSKPLRKMLHGFVCSISCRGVPGNFYFYFA